jgi:hypothetical protein
MGSVTATNEAARSDANHSAKMPSNAAMRAACSSISVTGRA